jgi:hypothetical protein
MSSVGVTRELANTPRNAPCSTQPCAKPDTRRLLIARLLLSALGLIQRFQTCTFVSTRQVTRPTTVCCYDVIANLCALKHAHHY